MWMRNGGESSGSREDRRWWQGRPAAVLLLLIVVVALGGLGIREMQSSSLQARYVSELVADVGFEVGEGPSDRIVFPEAGPYNERLGYVRLPDMLDSLEGRGFRIAEQARVTPRFLELVERGLYPLYREKPRAGLRVLDRRADEIHESQYPRVAYAAFDSIPEILWQSLLWIENRTLLDTDHPMRNPAVEWRRLSRSVLDMGMRALGSDRNVPGGSTLATQVEKFRHSPDGLTRTPRDKLRQMATATARAYMDGPETLEARRQVVLTYLNHVPLAAQRGHGEVSGTAEGLWAWYGTSFDEANRLLRGVEVTPGETDRRGEVYRQAVSLLIAHRRPSYYLGREVGREELRTLTDEHIRLLRGAGVVSAELAEAALGARIQVLGRAPAPEPVSFVGRKAGLQLRTHLLGLLDVPSLYDLDRYDLTLRSTLDLTWQEEAVDLFQALRDPEFVRARGFGADRMLDRGDPSRVIYSFTLLETTPLGNVVRVQADNYDGPLSLTQGGRIELGSTAKLRTLVTYLEAVRELHGRLSGLPPDSLRGMVVAERDRLTRWAVDHLLRNPGTELRPMLDAAMRRTYSASPAERFATGGGVQTFSNFDNTYDHRALTVLEAFRHSVNLPWVRIMRDVVHYHMFRGPGSTARMLEDPDVRQEYLSRFADQEGRRFQQQFHRKYIEVPPDEILEEMVRERDLSPQRIGWAYRAVVPGASLEALETFLRRHTSYTSLSREAVEDIYRRTDPQPHHINDLGYLARIHPLELWVARYLLENPGAELSTLLEASTGLRQEVYRWLFRTRIRNAQDQRIRTMLEIEAFEEIHRSWRRLGYPFGNIVPSYGTAIGSSGDRPLALAELMGIILNDGKRHRVVRVEEMTFAQDTPWETRVVREPAATEQVLPPEVAAVAREALVDVAENGTARRARGAVTGPDGQPLVVGGKTGTGDNRFRVYGAGGRLLESRAVNRTATLTFFLGDRWFGVVTAYVAGPEAAGYRFTSGLPSQILRELGPALSPLGAQPFAPTEAGESPEAPQPSEGVGAPEDREDGPDAADRG